MRRAAKRDTTEPEIVASLEAMGFSVNPTKSGNIGNFICQICGAVKRGRITNGRGKACSAKCLNQFRKLSMLGENNPNYKGNLCRENCKKCGVKFVTSKSKKFYCSEVCYNNNRTKKPKLLRGLNRVNGPPKACKNCKNACNDNRKIFCSVTCTMEFKKAEKLVLACQQCSANFETFPSADRKFCSYGCFLKSGGARRAGLASAEAIMKKYGAKKDANHREIMDFMNQFVAVRDLSACGYGIPDGIAYINGGWQLFDIKNPKTSYGKRGLNLRQKQWAADWRGGSIYLIYNIEDAKKFIKGEFESLKCELTQGHFDKMEHDAQRKTQEIVRGEK